MAIKAGQVLFTGNDFVVDRIQTGGVNNLNIPQEKIHEVGDFETVGIVYDIPDLSFEIESLDVSTDIEAILNRVDPSTVNDGDKLTFDMSRPLNVTSPFRAGNFLYNVVRGLVIPWLNLEQVTYRFGVRANAMETFTLRGDSIYYIPGTPWVDKVVATAATTYNFVNGPAIPLNELGNTIYALGVDWVDHTTGLYQRLFHGEDFTDTATGITIINAAKQPPVGADLHIAYGSQVPQNYPQSANTPATVKPAAVRSRDLDIFLTANPAGSTPAMIRLTGVQNVEINRRVNLENDEEFGNTHYISSDYDTADVNGTVEVRSTDPVDLFNKIAQLAQTDPTTVVGPVPTVPMEMELHINHPVTGARIKTIYSPDVIFTVPGVQGRQQQKLNNTWNWESQTGIVEVYKGQRPGGF